MNSYGTTQSLPNHETLASDVLDEMLGSFTVLQVVQGREELFGPRRSVRAKSAQSHRKAYLALTLSRIFSCSKTSIMAAEAAQAKAFPANSSSQLSRQTPNTAQADIQYVPPMLPGFWFFMTSCLATMALKGIPPENF